MKTRITKIGFLTIMSLLLFGCKKKEEQKMENKKMESKDMVSKCIDFADYDKLKTVEEKAKWLKDNQANICLDLLFKRSFDDHLITNEEFVKRSAGAKVTTIPWSDVEKYTNDASIGNYDKYVSFDTSSANIISLKWIDNYQTKPSSYSIALFRSIVKTDQIDASNSSSFKINFVVATDGEIIFNIFDAKSNKIVSNHNISSVPT